MTAAAEPGQRLGVVVGALAMASDAMSGAMLLGLAGALYGLGHDGLAWLIGPIAGLMLGAVLVTPHLHRGGCNDPVGFMRERYGRISALLALIVVMIASALLLSANSRALAVVLGAVTPTLANSEIVSLILAGMVFIAAATLGRLRSLTNAQAILYPLVFAALAMPIALLALNSAGATPNQLTYGSVLQDISRAELRLLESELADPVTMKAFARPFTTAAPWSGILLTISLALGFAVLPHVVRRPLLARSSDRARVMPAAALLLCVLAFLALPALAAMARHSVLTRWVGLDAASLPSEVWSLGQMGLVRICGVAAVAQEAVAAACAALEDPAQALRLDDIEVARDGILLAAPVVLGLPMIVSTAMAIMIASAAAMASAWLGHSLLASARAMAASASAAGKSMGFAALGLTLVAAVLISSAERFDILTLVAWALAVAAAGLAPPLIAGIWWHRASPAAAVLGIFTGAAIVIYYIIATRFWAPQFYELWGVFSSAGFGAIADYDAAKQALAAASDADRDAARLAYQEAARSVANLWGMRSVGVGALGALVGTIVMVATSLVTPRPTGEAVELMTRIRRAPTGV